MRCTMRPLSVHSVRLKKWEDWFWNNYAMPLLNFVWRKCIVGQRPLYFLRSLGSNLIKFYTFLSVWSIVKKEVHSSLGWKGVEKDLEKGSVIVLSILCSEDVEQNIFIINVSDVLCFTVWYCFNFEVYRWGFGIHKQHSWGLWKS